MKNSLRLLPLVAAGVLPLTATAQSLQQSFDDYAGIFSGANPWSLRNNSDSPTGGQSWFAGNPSVFTAQSGTGYAAANFLSTGGVTGTEHINNWLISPTLSLTNGTLISFYSRSDGAAPDRLELRLSTNGTSTNVGTTSSDFGDFSILLTSINPTLTAAVYPTTWTQFTAVVAGVPVGGTVGRIAFRYDVTNSGSNGANGDYVGVDNLNVVPEPSTYLLCLAGLAMGGWLVARHRRREPASAQA